jgi:ribonucleoside-triphosphate reductase
VGEEQPAPQAIATLVHETLRRTQCAQLTISPEFTYCQQCEHTARGIPQQCPACGSDRLVSETRVVGYFSKIQNWNRSKRYGELLARHRGRYAVTTADEEAAPALVTAAAPDQITVAEGVR